MRLVTVSVVLQQAVVQLVMGGFGIRRCYSLELMMLLRQEAFR
jgi:hypothetical protein